MMDGSVLESALEADALRAREVVSEIILSPEEVAALTGYAKARKQVEELKRVGFVRARLNPFGRVILERAHYQAVSTGNFATQAVAPEPELMPITPKRRRKAVP